MATKKPGTSQQKINRGELARQVLENPIYKEAFLMIRSVLVEKLSGVNPVKKKELQEITRTFQNLNKIEKVLKRTYETGKVEAKKPESGVSEVNVI